MVNFAIHPCDTHFDVNVFLILHCTSYKFRTVYKYLAIMQSAKLVSLTNARYR